MKKALIIILVLGLAVVGGVVLLLGGAGDFIKEQIEQQGTKYMETPVSVSSVELSVTEGYMSINGMTVKNPTGFSDANAFSLGAVELDLGSVTSEPYTVQTVSVNAPEVLYEFNESGDGNLLVLKNNLQANLPTSSEPEPSTESGANPLVIVENVTINGVKLKLDFENLPTGDLELETKSYEVTLPEFQAGSIGKPNGIPADQVGAAIVDAMLDNLIAKAKEEAKDRLEEEAKKKLKEEVDKKKDELLDKAKGKLGDLLGNG